MKIYFAGSIRAGRQDQQLYGRIINFLGKFGTVLTEHVGNDRITERGDPEIKEEEIFQRDMAWLKQANVVVAEITRPSLGVGYELAVAEQMQKPLLCLKQNNGKSLSAMIAGNRSFSVTNYSQPEELPKIFSNFFASVK